MKGGKNILRIKILIYFKILSIIMDGIRITTIEIKIECIIFVLMGKEKPDFTCGR